MQAKLIVVGGSANKRELPLRLPVIVGRDRDAGLQIIHPTISRRHCEIFERDGMLMVSDLGSLNGILVSDARVTEAVLRPGDKLTVGPLTFRAEYAVVVPGAAPAEKPAAKATKPAPTAPQRAVISAEETLAAASAVTEPVAKKFDSPPVDSNADLGAGLLDFDDDDALLGAGDAAAELPADLAGLDDDPLAKLDDEAFAGVHAEDDALGALDDGDNAALGALAGDDDALGALDDEVALGDDVALGDEAALGEDGALGLLADDQPLPALDDDALAALDDDALDSLPVDDSSLPALADDAAFASLDDAEELTFTTDAPSAGELAEDDPTPLAEFIPLEATLDDRLAAQPAAADDDPLGLDFDDEDQPLLASDSPALPSADLAAENFATDALDDLPLQDTSHVASHAPVTEPEPIDEIDEFQSFNKIDDDDEWAAGLELEAATDTPSGKGESSPELTAEDELLGDLDSFDALDEELASSRAEPAAIDDDLSELLLGDDQSALDVSDARPSDSDDSRLLNAIDIEQLGLGELIDDFEDDELGLAAESPANEQAAPAAQSQGLPEDLPSTDLFPVDEPPAVPQQSVADEVRPDVAARKPVHPTQADADKAVAHRAEFAEHDEDVDAIAAHEWIFPEPGPGESIVLLSRDVPGDAATPLDEEIADEFADADLDAASDKVDAGNESDAFDFAEPLEADQPPSLSSESAPLADEFFDPLAELAPATDEAPPAVSGDDLPELDDDAFFDLVGSTESSASNELPAEPVSPIADEPLGELDQTDLKASSLSNASSLSDEAVDPGEVTELAASDDAELDELALDKLLFDSLSDEAPAAEPTVEGALDRESPSSLDALPLDDALFEDAPLDTLPTDLSHADISPSAEPVLDELMFEDEPPLESHAEAQLEDSLELPAFDESPAVRASQLDAPTEDEPAAAESIDFEPATPEPVTPEAAASASAEAASDEDDLFDFLAGIDAEEPSGTQPADAPADLEMPADPLADLGEQPFPELAENVRGEPDALSVGDATPPAEIELAGAAEIDELDFGVPTQDDVDPLAGLDFTGDAGVMGEVAENDAEQAEFDLGLNLPEGLDLPEDAVAETPADDSFEPIAFESAEEPQDDSFDLFGVKDESPASGDSAAEPMAPPQPQQYGRIVAGGFGKAGADKPKRSFWPFGGKKKQPVAPQASAAPPPIAAQPQPQLDVPASLDFSAPAELAAPVQMTSPSELNSPAADLTSPPVVPSVVVASLVPSELPETNLSEAAFPGASPPAPAAPKPKRGLFGLGKKKSQEPPVTPVVPTAATLPAAAEAAPAKPSKTKNVARTEQTAPTEAKPKRGFFGLGGKKSKSAPPASAPPVTSASDDFVPDDSAESNDVVSNDADELMFESVDELELANSADPLGDLGGPGLSDGLDLPGDELPDFQGDELELPGDVSNGASAHAQQSADASDAMIDFVEEVDLDPAKPPQAKKGSAAQGEPAKPTKAQPPASKSPADATADDNALSEDELDAFLRDLE